MYVAFRKPSVRTAQLCPELNGGSSNKQTEDYSHLQSIKSVSVALPCWSSFKKTRKEKNNLIRQTRKSSMCTLCVFMRLEQFVSFRHTVTFVIFQYLRFRVLKDISHWIYQFGENIETREGEKPEICVINHTELKKLCPTAGNRNHLFLLLKSFKEMLK